MSFGNKKQVTEIRRGRWYCANFHERQPAFEWFDRDIGVVVNLMRAQTHAATPFACAATKWQKFFSLQIKTTCMQLDLPCHCLSRARNRIGRSWAFFWKKRLHSTSSWTHRMCGLLDVDTFAKNISKNGQQFRFDASNGQLDWMASEPTNPTAI